VYDGQYALQFHQDAGLSHAFAVKVFVATFDGTLHV
jgi:hypothetical protein